MSELFLVYGIGVKLTPNNLTKALHMCGKEKYKQYRVTGVDYSRGEYIIHMASIKSQKTDVYTTKTPQKLRNLLWYFAVVSCQ